MRILRHKSSQETVYQSYTKLDQWVYYTPKTSTTSGAEPDDSLNVRRANNQGDVSHTHNNNNNGSNNSRGYVGWLNSLASDLDLMLNDICRGSFPYGNSTRPQISAPRPGFRACQHLGEDPILEQYVTSAAALVDDEDEEDEGGGVAGDDEYTSNVENKTPSDGSSESEFFSVDEDVQSSDGAVAGSDAGSPTPFYPAPISPVAAITVTSPRASHPGSPRTQGSVSHMAPFPRSEGNLFQACYGSSQHQTPPQNEGGTFPTPSNPQHHTLTLSERVKRTHPLWYLPNVHRTEACRLLFDKEQGTFVVRQASEPGRMVLSLRTGLKPSIEHFLIQNAGVGLKLKGCFRSFEDISKLITHYGHNQDGLPVQLVLPHAVMQAKTHQELTSLALLGQDFWTSSISRPAPVIRTVFHTTISPQHDTHTHQKIAHHNSVNYHREPHSRWQPSKLSSPSVTPPFENIWNKQSDASHYQNVSNDLLGNCAISTDVKTKLGVSKTDSSPIIHKEYNSLSLTNHSRECSAFCTPPVHDLDTTAYNNYNVTELADKLSDYEDAQGPFFQPILHNSSDTSSNVGDKNSHGSGIYDLVGCNALHNPGYMSDCLSEKSDYIDSHFLINLDLEKVSGKKLYLATEHVEKTEKVRLMQLVPKRLVRNGPAVFTFTVVPSTPTDGTPAPATPGGQISVGKVSSAGSQHSTPSYIEPYDSLLPKVAGAGHNIPVVRVNNILKQPGNHHYVNSLEVKPCQADVTPNHHSYSMSLEIKPPPAPHRTEVHHDENKSNIIPRNKHEVHHVSMKMPQNSGLHQRRRETSSMLISHLEVVKKPPPKVFIRSQSLRCLPTTGNKAKEWRAQSLPRDVSDLKAKGHHRGSLQTVIEPSSHVCVPVHTTVNPEQHLANGRCEGIKAPLSSKETREINSHLDEILGNLDELHMLIDDPLPPTKMLSATLRRFPQGHSQLSLNSGQTAYSDTCTAEDVLNNISPELTLRPIKPLTAKNLQRRSDYDNLSNMWGPSSRRTIASSVGTHYSQPWDSNILQDLITFGSIAQQGKFPMPTDKGNRDSFASRHSAMTEYSVYESESGRAPSEFSFEMAPPDGASPPTGQNVRVCVQASDDEGMEDDQNLGTLPLHGAVEHIIAPSKSSVLGNKRRSSLPGIKVRDYVSDLAQNRRTTFGKTVDNFIACTKEGTENNPHIVIRNIRQFMNGIKNYLVQNGEGALNDVIEEERKHLGQNEFLNIDALLEGALHKCVVKPLERHILALFVKEYKSNGSLQNMKDNIEYARTKTPFELGIKPEFLPPEGRSMEKIKQSLHKMQRAYSPTVKLHHLLGATSAIYKLIQEIEDNETASSTNSTVSLGADDFLPMFIYVLVQCGMVSAEIEVDYMWGLLHPYILAGEGGYHLTTLSSAVHVLKNLKNTMESTTDCPRLPSLGDLQGFMKIIIPDEDNHSIITKILPVRPNMTTKDVVNMIAHRFKFTNPQDYGLYILISGVGTEDRLQDGDCPQTIKESVIHEGRECVFAYKRNNAKFVWPIIFKS